MSDEMFYQDGFEDERESNGMKALREKAEADSKALREMSEKLDKALNALQERDLKDAVTAKSLSPKVVDLAKKAGVTDSEGLETFLKDYGDVFGAPSNTSGEGDTGEQPGDSTVPAEEQAALAGMAAAAQTGAPQVGLEALESKINGAESAEDLLKLLGVN